MFEGDLRGPGLTGIWLGLNSEGNVWRSNAVRSVPEGEQWDFDLLNSVDVFPWGALLAGEELEEQVPEEVADPIRAAEIPVAPEPARDPEYVPRGAMIQRKDLLKYGFTPNCRRCGVMLSGSPAPAGLPHSAVCRSRVRSEMAKGPERKIHLETARQRKRAHQEKNKCPDGSGH